MLFKGQIEDVNEDVMGTTIPTSFRSFMKAQISAFPPGEGMAFGLCFCLFVCLFLDRGSSSGFHLAFPTIIHSCGQGTSVRIMPAAEYIYFNYAF